MQGRISFVLQSPGFPENQNQLNPRNCSDRILALNAENSVDIQYRNDRFAEIKFIADLIQSIENLVGSCIVTVITDGGI